MFNQYTYKQKFSALIVVFVLLSITAYKRSFSQLLSSYSEYKSLSAKNNEFDSKSKQLGTLTNDVATLDQVLGKGGKDKEVIQQEIINFIANKHPEVAIHNIQPIHFFKEDNFTIITNTVDLTGNSNQLLRTAYDFEKEFDTSKIVSLQLYTEKKSDKEEKLHLKLVFQNYEGF